MRRLLARADSLGIAISFGTTAAICALGKIDFFAQYSVVLIGLSIVAWLGLATTTGLFHVDERRLDCSAGPRRS
jgi:hypothetical protein